MRTFGVKMYAAACACFSVHSGIRFFCRPYSAALSFPPRGMTGTSGYCFEYNLHLIKTPSHLNRESIHSSSGEWYKRLVGGCLLLPDYARSDINRLSTEQPLLTGTRRAYRLVEGSFPSPDCHPPRNITSCRIHAILLPPWR